MQERSRSQMNVRDAAFHTVRNYPGGAASLAPRMGMSAQVLNHKTNPNNQTRFNLTLEEAVELQAITDNHAILYAMARELEHTCSRQNAPENHSVSEGIAQVLKDMGDLVSKVSEVISDGMVTDNEMRAADEKFAALMNDMNALRGLLARNNDEHKANKMGRTA